MGKATSEPDPDAVIALNEKFLLICQEVGKASEGELFRGKAESFYDNLIAELNAQYKLSLKEKAPPLTLKD